MNTPFIRQADEEITRSRVTNDVIGVRSRAQDKTKRRTSGIINRMPPAAEINRAQSTRQGKETTSLLKRHQRSIFRHSGSLLRDTKQRRGEEYQAEPDETNAPCAPCAASADRGYRAENGQCRTPSRIILAVPSRRSPIGPC